MVFQLCREAGKRWRKLKGAEWLRNVAAGDVFVDGELVDETDLATNVA